MSKIPKDIAEKAFDAAATYAAEDCISDLEKAIVALLMGERERCARIVKEAGEVDFGDANVSECVAEYAIEAIMKGSAE